MKQALKKAHPDLSGTPTEFKEAQSIYRQYLEKQEMRRSAYGLPLFNACRVAERSLAQRPEGAIVFIKQGDKTHRFVKEDGRAKYLGVRSENRKAAPAVKTLEVAPPKLKKKWQPRARKFLPPSAQ